MEDALLDLLCTSLIPELGSDIAACPSGDIELVLIIISALGAYPCKLVVSLLDLDLAVKTAYLAVIRLRVELSIHDVVIDISHNVDDSIDIILHVGNFDIADGSSGRESLELGLE